MPPESETLFIKVVMCLGCCISINVASKCLVNQESTIQRHFYVEEQDLEIKIEVSHRITHQLVSSIFQILLNEVIGYPNVTLKQSNYTEVVGENSTHTLQRMTGCKHPKACSEIGPFGPDITINLEVWIPPGFNMEGWLTTGKVDDAGPLGPVGRSGWFVAEYIVRNMWKANKTAIDHWKAFTNPAIVALFDLSRGDNMLESFTMNQYTNTTYCTFADCKTNGIYRPKQCQKNGISCATLLADFPESNFNILKHQIDDLRLLVNVAWVGPNLEHIVNRRTIEKKHTVFFHQKPSYLSSLRNFTHISFPDCQDDETVSICQFSLYQMEKLAWSKVKTNAAHAFHLMRAMTFSQSEYTSLLYRYNRGKMRDYSTKQIACEWINDFRYYWEKWIPQGLNKTVLYIGGIFPISGIYGRQRGVIPAARMAVDAVNRNSSLLKDYHLALLEQDGRCVADEVMKCFINYVTNSTYKTMVGILGPACSDTVEPIAGVAQHFNTIIISYSAEGSLFTDRERYRYFFRTIPENNQFRYVYLKLFKQLHWSRVAALTEDGQKYPEYISHLQDLMQTNDMNFIINRKFPRERTSLDMKHYLTDLKNRNAKIIIGEFYDYAARAVMCDAYHLGMTAANGYQWFLPLWFTSDWFDTDLHNTESSQWYENVPCTTAQMIEAVNGHISLAFKFYANDDDIMQEGKKVKEWYTSYKKFATVKEMELSRYGGYAYDAVWVYALALDALFRERLSSVATLHSDSTSRRLVELLNTTELQGVSGPLKFIGSSRISEVVIWQWLKNTTHKIGVYRPFSQDDGILELNESRIVWLTPDGRQPSDGSLDENTCLLASVQELLNTTCETAIVILNIFIISFLVFTVLLGFIFFKRRYDMRVKATEARMKELGLITASGLLALDEWEMPRDHIVINRKLGEGAFGTVYGGEALIEGKGWVAVAVKTLKIGAKSDEKIDFLSEAEIMKKFDHHNIVQLIGVCTMNEPVYTVMEFMLYGDLKTYLLGRRHLVNQEDRSKNDEVSDWRLTNMACDISRGLSYLADMKYVHRDLACRNCLVTAARSVKIGDFGMCRAMYDSDYYRFNRKGMLPVRWMAPESLIDGLFTPMSDVWSYGVLLYEIITFGSFPYQGLSNNQVLEYVKNYNTLSVPKGCKSSLEDLLKKCWCRNPSQRPQAVDILESLTNDAELIAPCLDMPMASVEVEDTDSLEITIHDRSRVHSVSSMWHHRRHQSTPDHISSGYIEPNQPIYSIELEKHLPEVQKKISAAKVRKMSDTYVPLSAKNLHQENNVAVFSQVTCL